DLRGVVDLLSSAIYTTPSVYLRELIQNATDAISARRQHDPSWSSGGIVITPAGISGPNLSVRDDGIGLTADEITDFLATVGSSLKRDTFGLPAEGMLGRFGIGLLSALMVSDEIRVRTRSARGGPSLEWVGRGDGTFTLHELGEDLSVGTEVILHTRPDDSRLVGPDAVRRLAQHYARYLPVPITVGQHDRPVSVTEPPPFLSADRDTVLGFGADLIGAQPFDAIALDIPLTGTRGVAYVLPHPVPPNSGGAHQVYCRRMLVSERCRDIVPEWAFFARVVLDSTGLNPTASREGLIDDPALGATRDAIGATLRAWISRLAATDPLRLEAFVATHYLGLKALAVHDDEIAPLIVRLLPLETSRGLRTIGEIVAHSTEISYVPTTDQFRQVNALSSNRQVVVNATYTWDAEVLHRLPSLIPGVIVREVSVNAILDRLEAVPAPERATALRLEARAGAVLSAWEATAAVRLASSGDVPAFLLTDPDLLRRSERRKARENGSSRWAGILNALDQATASRDAAAGTTVLLNWANPLVRRLADVEEVVFARSVRLLYLQAVLATGRPLTSAESEALTSTLTDLMILGLGDTGAQPTSKEMT
ncbi:MAG: HSP90 family protein, partial [Propionibacteriaceae bacterium]|nr:HSP90 family protein [Propionibacteriaceae bacterium]